MAENLSADVVVIGSGICGALAALALRKRGASVLMLEAGPRMDRGRLVAAFRNSPRKSDWMAPYPYSPWAPHPVYKPDDNGYLMQAGPYPYPAEYIRAVGGTSWHWAAHAWRLVPNDLRIRSLYDVGVDWPISYDDLDPWYQQAEEIMGVCGSDQTGSPRSKPFPMEPVAEPWAMRRIRERLEGTYPVVANTVARNSRTYGGRPACVGNNSCQPICPVNAQYTGGVAVAGAEAAGVRLVENAVVYRIEHDARDRVSAVHYYDPDKGSHRVTGKQFILAANGIESPKLLLFSTSDRFPNGIANRSGTVGHKLMDHPSTSLAFYADEELWLGRGPQSPSSINTMRDGEFRRRHSPYRLDFTNISQVLGATEALIAEGVYGPEFDKQLRYRAAHQMSVKTVLEVLPDPTNRITLGTKKDALGIPHPQVHYNVDDYTRAGAKAAIADFARIAGLMGGTQLRYSDPEHFANNQHITGTLSMGTDPTDSVTDPWGRAHDHENLFMCGTGVMPTSATMNSTLTGVALALRTADHMLGAAGVPSDMQAAQAEASAP
ncbi:GMC family oxidoreductase [Aerolutibacter ruishenii]|uniref:Choline dehydrogenase-like flavoprotein n=1 Tax=Aerolutibacter ruishenii TaxID=686800 RepID=A0A562LYQ1_9GAMM|nr:GMC family oxidoreductase [Lysobacter ruishenii]TWI12779.1 choline dehydrogenase-like flavoprotein [Lysobacter ruishenii]